MLTSSSNFSKCKESPEEDNVKTHYLRLKFPLDFPEKRKFSSADATDFALNK